MTSHGQFRSGGGAGGTGGKVTGINKGLIVTLGGLEHGIFGHSIGGDGGRGGKSDMSVARLAGGDYTMPSSIANGGKDGAGGRGGTVSLENRGIIRTTGARSNGILAHSMGGRGSRDGDGNTVTVINKAGALISTFGPGSNGIVAQSLGGGLNTNGGRVTVANSGMISTSGRNAIGILAQSIGGSTVPFHAGITLGSAGLTSSGGEVSVTLSNSAAVQTKGINAPAIFARSIGGDSGQVLTSDDASTANSRGTNSRAVNLEIGMDGSSVLVEATSGGSAGIHAQIDGGNAIHLQIGNRALVVGGKNTLADGKDAASIFMDGGTNNVVVNSGSITSQTGVDGTAFYSNSAASTSLTNAGTITGSQIFASTVMLANLKGGTLNTGRTLRLGPEGVVSNGGTIDPGGRGRLLTTAVTGNLHQSSSGRLVLESDHARGRSDRLEVSGTALLDGAVDMRPLSLTKQPVMVLEAKTLIVTPTLSTTQTQLFSYNSIIKGGSLLMAPHADLTPAGQNMNSTQADVAARLQQIWNSGDPRYGANFAALSRNDGPQPYAASLDSLAGQVVGAVGISRWLASNSFTSNLNSCATFVGDSQLLAEADCGWTRIIGGHADRSSSNDTVGFTQNTVTIQAGGQNEISPGWFVGGALAYESSRLDGDNDTAKVNGDSALAGLIVKRQAGALLLSTAADLSFGWYQSRRTIKLGDAKLTAKADPDAQSAGLHARAAYEVPLQRWYLRPTLDLHAAYVRMDGYSESNAVPFNLNVESSDKMFLAAVPTLELGTRLDLPDDSSLRAFASAGVAFFTDNDWQSKARFDDSSTNSFDSELPMPNTLARVGLGLEMVTTKHITAKLQYGGDFGDDYSSHTGMFRVGYTF
jgi:outer membrane autotransporter protein